MPWREIEPMDEKIRLIAAVMEQEHSISELCASFGISRKTAYKWLRRYDDDPRCGLLDRSRAPHRVPWAIGEAQAEAILGLRYAHPSWGPRKLRAKLAQREPDQRWPAPSTIGELLCRQGLTHPRRRPISRSSKCASIAFARSSITSVRMRRSARLRPRSTTRARRDAILHGSRTRSIRPIASCGGCVITARSNGRERPSSSVSRWSAKSWG